jgi:hypothetical protein
MVCTLGNMCVVGVKHAGVGLEGFNEFCKGRVIVEKGCFEANGGGWHLRSSAERGVGGSEGIKGG